jgi:hypothetical protein
MNFSIIVGRYKLDFLPINQETKQLRKQILIFN